jgi:hypothetical protein
MLGKKGPQRVLGSIKGQVADIDLGHENLVEKIARKSATHVGVHCHGSKELLRCLALVGELPEAKAKDGQDERFEPVIILH